MGKFFYNAILKNSMAVQHPILQCICHAQNKKYIFVKATLISAKHNHKCTVVDKKNRDTRCYSDTYHRREMKLVPFFMAK